ncbi:MAG: glycosyl hydrolase [Actinomycetota bacterium]
MRRRHNRGRGGLAAGTGLVLAPLLLGAGCGFRSPFTRSGAPPPPVAAEAPTPTPVAESFPETEADESLTGGRDAVEVTAPRDDWGPATAQGFRVAETGVPLPKEGGSAQVESPALRQLRETAERRPSAYAWRQLADAAVEAGRYQEAAAAYRREAGIRREEGDPNAAAVEEGKAQRWESTALLYRETPVTLSGSAVAKFEPESGCYVGAIVERDPRVGGDHGEFNRLTGKQHSVFFDYRSHGVGFPSDWAASLRSVGAAAQIAFEPNAGLDSVRDDAYLRGFARDAARAELPVFLRFAGEFNGDWTRWSGNPTRYIEKWRLVHRVMREEAPNVAMVWTPNVIPEENIPSFYPGDDFVDWVGVNCYTVHHHNNSLEHPAEHENPADMLRSIYNRYAKRKPIMIGEYAASHYCKADNKELPDFAADKLRALYASLPRLYPRVKAMHWYDIDNTSHAVRAGRDTNNFSLTDNETVLDTYRKAVRSPYFLPRVPTSKEPVDSVRLDRLEGGQKLSGTIRLSAWIKTFNDRPTVVYRLDGRPQAALRRPPYEAEWDTTAVKNGEHTLEAAAYVDGKRVVLRRATVRVVNAAALRRGSALVRPE